MKLHSNGITLDKERTKMDIAELLERLTNKIIWQVEKEDDDHKVFIGEIERFKLRWEVDYIENKSRITIEEDMS